MRKRYGKFYADWRDEHGHRHMKAFASKAKAQAYTRRMRKTVTEKKVQPTRKLRRTSERGPRTRRAAHS